MGFGPHRHRSHHSAQRQQRGTLGRGKGVVINPMEEDGASSHYQPMMLNTQTLLRYSSHTMVNPDGSMNFGLSEAI